MTPPSANDEHGRAEQPSTEPFKLDLAKLREMHAGELAVRFGFGFAVSVVAGIIVKVAGPVFGGMFLAFPAILPATATLLEKKHGLAQATADIRGATVGAVAMVGFAWTAWTLLTRRSAPFALATAMAVWLLGCLMVYGMMRAIVQVLGENHYLPEIPTSEAALLLDTLRLRSLSLATAESCTGGLVASFLSSVPNASTTFRGAVVAYDDDVKSGVLDVPAELVEGHGAVSAAVAAAMARQVREVMGADVGLAVTGLTGAGADGKPAGLTFVAVTLPDGQSLIRRYTDDFGPGRNDERAVRMAFKIARDALDRRADDKHNVDESVDR